MNRDYWFAAVIFILSLIIFTRTLCPTIYWQDSSAFIAAAHTLGIPFSPGFPVYILLGRIFSLIPAQNPAWPINFMSALFGSLSLALFFLLMVKLLHKFVQSKDSSIYLTASAFTLLLAFSTSFLSQTFRAEVYTLNFFFTLLLIFSLWKWSENREENPDRSGRYFILFAFLWGLSSANHSLLVVSLAPAFLLFILLVDRRFFFKPINLIFSLFFGLLGVSSYLFLLIRSRQNPALNWANPDNWESLWKVITKSDTWQNSFNSANSNLWVNLIQIFNFLSAELWLPVIIIALLGGALLFARQKKFNLLLTAILICNLIVVAWAAEFSIRNLDLLGYLLPSLMVLIIWSAVGGDWLIRSVSARVKNLQPKLVAPALSLLFLILPVWQLTRNYSKSDYHQNWYTYQYGRQLLDSVLANSVILATEDNTLLPLWYFTLVEKYRPDVVPLAWTILDNPDYLRDVKLRRPTLNFPAGAPTKSDWLESFQRLNPGLSIFTQPVNFAPQVQAKLSPQGFLLKYSDDPADLAPEVFDRQSAFLNALFDDLKSNEDLDLVTREHFANFFFNTGVYYDRRLISDQSLLNFLRALRLDQANDRYYLSLGQAFLKTGRFLEAYKFFSAAVEINPYREDNQRFLAISQDSLNLHQKKTLP